VLVNIKLYILGDTSVLILPYLIVKKRGKR